MGSAPRHVTVYGKVATVQVLVMDALWQVASGGELMRLVVIRGLPGHEKDDVFVSTDTKLSPRYVIETYAKRWSLEVTFHEVKGKLGFEDPCNRACRRAHGTARSRQLQPHCVLVRPSRPTQSSRAPTDDALVHPQGGGHLLGHARDAAQSLLEPETF